MGIVEPPMMLRNALRRLADDARREAAMVGMETELHAFYMGVVAATEDRIHPAMGDIHGEKWLQSEKPAFRDGYVKARHVIASAGPAPVRLHLPAPAQ